MTYVCDDNEFSIEKNVGVDENEICRYTLMIKCLIHVLWYLILVYTVFIRNARLKWVKVAEDLKCIARKGISCW